MKRSATALIAGLALFALSGCTATTPDADSPPAASAAAGKDEVVLYLVRHGQTQFNVKSIVSGWSDSPLTAKGLDQAEAAGEALADESFVAAYSSDLDRAEHTAELILEENSAPPALKPMSGLREHFYGGFEGDTDEVLWTPLMEGFGFSWDPEWSNYAAFANAVSDEEVADAVAALDDEGLAEDWKQISTRTTASIQTIVEDAEGLGGGNVLVVAHGGIIATILEQLDPDDYSHEDIPNASVSIVKYDGEKFHIIQIGTPTYVQ